MKKTSITLALASLFFSTVYAQQILSCVVKEANGTAKTSEVANVKTDAIIDIPLSALRENGSKYESDDVFRTKEYGETTMIVIDRNTGEFAFSAWSGSFSSFEKTSLKAKGACTRKKTKL